MEETAITMKFVGPSGYTYEIREENGADEEVISNQAAAKDFMNITNYIAGIVVNTDFTTSGKLSPQEALDLPLLDRYVILIQSRMFSLGKEVEFSYTWPGDSTPTYYTQDISELIFSNYKEPISEVEKASKPFAIPRYDMAEEFKSISYKGYELTLDSGKRVKFDISTGRTERYTLLLPESSQTRNSELKARNLQVLVDGRWEVVENFGYFTRKELSQIRSVLVNLDPLYMGLVEIENPKTGEKLDYPIFTTPNFFFPTEA